MKIEKIRIENFRCFEDVEIPLDDYTCFIGPNGSGKSTVLQALNVFFRHNKDAATDVTKLSRDDFHHKDTSKPIRITVTFGSLPEEAINELKAYVRQGKLVISAQAVFDAQGAEVKQYGQRMGVERFREFFDAEKAGARASELQEIFARIRSENKYREIPNARSKDDMKKALWEYEETHPEECTLIPSEDQFYGVSRGVDKLEKYVQWVYIPSVKNVVEEGIETKESALGALLGRTVRGQVNFEPRLQELKARTEQEYQAIVDAEQAVLTRLTEAITRSLRTWAHPSVSAQVIWGQSSDKAIRLEKPVAAVELVERGFSGDPARFGHGLQRSLFLALMQELSAVSDDTQPTLIMGIEEPELYQHPPQARHLAEVLKRLSDNNSQIITCSHSPLFIPGDNVEAIRLVRETGTPSKSHITRLSYAELNRTLAESGQRALKETGIVAKLYPSLNPVISEMFFCQTLVLVEGAEDAAYIYSCLAIEGRLDDFRKYGCHIVPVGGKSMFIKPIAMAKHLEIPTFVVFDADTNEAKQDRIQQHRKENASIQKLLGERGVDDWPTADRWGHNYVMWAKNMTAMVEEEMGAKWHQYMQAACDKYGHPGGLQKNPLAIAYAMELAQKEGTKSVGLVRLITKILDFAEASWG